MYMDILNEQWFAKRRLNPPKQHSETFSSSPFSSEQRSLHLVSPPYVEKMGGKEFAVSSSPPIRNKFSLSKRRLDTWLYDIHSVFVSDDFSQQIYDDMCEQLHDSLLYSFPPDTTSNTFLRKIFRPK